MYKVSGPQYKMKNAKYKIQIDRLRVAAFCQTESGVWPNHRAALHPVRLSQWGTPSLGT